MPKQGRPTGPVPGTELVRVLDHEATRNLSRIAWTQADDGPEGLMDQVPDVIDGWEPDVGGSQHHIDNSDVIRDLFSQRYARGVADALSWIAGEPPSAELLELLGVKED